MAQAYSDSSKESKGTNAPQEIDVISFSSLPPPYGLLSFPLPLFVHQVK